MKQVVTYYKWQDEYLLLIEQREDAGVLVIVESGRVGTTAGWTLDTTVAATGTTIWLLWNRQSNAKILPLSPLTCIYFLFIVAKHFDRMLQHTFLARKSRFGCSLEGFVLSIDWT